MDSFEEYRRKMQIDTKLSILILLWVLDKLIMIAMFFWFKF